MPSSWFSIRAVAANEAEVFIYDEIGAYAVTAKDFVAELKKVAGKDLTLRINSPGGSIFEGSAIFNALKRHKGKVTTQIDGLAASMASYIALAGQPVRMAQNAMLMIHNPSGIVLGESKDMRKMADTLDKLRQALTGAYCAKTGQDEDQMNALMDEETWFTAAEAQDIGLIDEVTDEVVATASFDLSKFRHVPPEARALVDTRAKAMTTKEISELQARVDHAEQESKNAWQEREQAKADLVTSKASLASAIGREETAKAALTTEQTAHALTNTHLTAVTAERDTLQAADKTAAGKAAEALAKNGIAPGVKQEPGKLAETLGDAVALWEDYAHADSTRQAHLRAKHGAKLDDAAVAWDQAQAAQR